ncbi:MAG: hypothetical protein IJP17_03530, partial [Clostridia bacterium]|nr:hypothetical protein [Clostridia bacterium]
MKHENKANILSVSIRLAIIAAMLGGAFFLYTQLQKQLLVSAQGAAPIIFKVGISLFIAAAVIVLAQLVAWAFKWVGKERVSELGLHIVRFAAILTAVVLSVFAMMTKDYNDQYYAAIENELCQQALAGRMYIQQGIGEDVEDSISYYD